jgi:hypothetical protein
MSIAFRLWVKKRNTSCHRSNPGVQTYQFPFHGQRSWKGMQEQYLL